MFRKIHLRWLSETPEKNSLTKELNFGKLACLRERSSGFGILMIASLPSNSQDSKTEKKEEHYKLANCPQPIGVWNYQGKNMRKDPTIYGDMVLYTI